MTEPSLLQLFPAGNTQPQPLNGLYLQHRLQRQGTAERPLVYSNYVVSLDGRIAIGTPGSCRPGIPDALTSDVDWRLYQELAAQAEVLLTSGRYMRELEQGSAQAGLPVGEGFTDLTGWRREQGLDEQPAVVILSRSLDLPLELLPQLGRTVYVATGANADRRKLAAVAETGASVLLAGEGKGADGCRLVAELGAKGYRSIYSIAGPGLLDTLLRAGMVDRLYLTQVHTMLGGKCYDTLLESRVLEPAARFVMEELYFDSGGVGRQAQLFGVYRKSGGD